MIDLLLVASGPPLLVQLIIQHEWRVILANAWYCCCLLRVQVLLVSSVCYSYCQPENHFNVYLPNSSHTCWFYSSISYASLFKCMIYINHPHHAHAYYTYLYIMAGFIATRLFLMVISSSSVTLSYTNGHKCAKYYYFLILNTPSHYRDIFHSWSSISYVFLSYYRWSTREIGNLHLWNKLYSLCSGNGLVPFGQ